MTTTLLIDGDPVAYRGAVYATSAGQAADSACRQVDRWIGDVDRAVVCFSCPRADCFRRLIDPTYKPDREGKPLDYLEAARDGLRSRFICREIPGLEADDVLGMLATAPGWNCRKVIVADDKDLLTVPGLHSRPVRDAKGRTVGRELQEVTADEADRHHLIQTLVGDDRDGYPGCPGVGEVGAPKLLAGTPNAAAWPVIVKAFARAKLGRADALKQARLARVLRADEYDVETRTVRLWSPAGCPPVLLRTAEAAEMVNA